LKDVILVDNSIFSCALQLDNGVPVLPFFFDQEDRELLFLQEYLKDKVYPAKDVRIENKKAFDLKSLIEISSQELFNVME